MVMLTNNAVTRLASSLTTGATSLSVSAGDGAKFPAPSGGEWFPVTIIKASGSLEITRCTARSGDVLTVSRGQEGTAAQAFSAGDRVELRLTAGAVADVVAMIEALRNDALLDANNLGDVVDKAAARLNLGLTQSATTLLTSSHRDNTVDRILKVGDFGYGAPLNIGNEDLNTILDSGFYRTNNNPNAPGGGVDGFSPLIVIRAGDTIAQMVVGFATGNFYVRGGNPASIGGSGSWGSWKQFYSNGVVSAVIQALMGAADQAAARAAIGAVNTPEKRVCTAWVNFNGVGTVTIRDSYNVSSISDNGVGSYNVNFATAMGSANYSLAGSGGFPSGGGGSSGMFLSTLAGSRTTTGVAIATTNPSGSSFDAAEISVQIMGGTA